MVLKGDGVKRGVCFYLSRAISWGSERVEQSSLTGMVYCTR